MRDEPERPARAPSGCSARMTCGGRHPHGARDPRTQPRAALDALVLLGRAARRCVAGRASRHRDRPHRSGRCRSGAIDVSLYRDDIGLRPVVPGRPQRHPRRPRRRHRGARRRRAVHRAHGAGRARRRRRVRAPPGGAACRARRPRPPGAADPPRLRRQEPADEPRDEDVVVTEQGVEIRRGPP